MQNFKYDALQGSLVIRGELTIYQISEALEALRSAIENGQLKTIDLAEVTEIDTAGLQFLLAAEKISQSKYEPVQLVKCSQPVVDVFVLAGCAQHLSDAPRVGSTL